MYKYLFTFFVILVVPLAAHAATVTVVPPDHTPGVGEQLYVDIMLDPEGVSINGVEQTITFTPSTLSFVRAEDGSSIVALWMERPTVVSGSIELAGIIPNGFSGLIDPFDTAERRPGKIVRLVFAVSGVGNAAVSTHTTLTRNDGEGSIEPVADARVTFATTAIATQTYTPSDTIPPVLVASRTQDPALFDGKYALVFSATDQGSGVAYVEVKEKKHSWKKVSSPYLLEDQTDNATLQVRAVDYAGNDTIVAIGTVMPLNTVASYVFFALLLIVGFPLMVYYYRRYAKN